MDEEAVEPQAEMDQMIEEAHVDQEPIGPDEFTDVAVDHEEEAYKKTMIPLSVAQKLRMKNKELELENQWMKQQQQAAQKPIDDSSGSVAATKDELRTSQEEAIRAIEERLWIKQNPEKYEMVTNQLPQFLKQRPNLASAIQTATNRYEEAFELMDKLTPKQQAQLKKESAPVVKKPAPNAPTGVPKSVAMAEAVDVMSMSDSEFAAWRNSKKRRR